MAHITGGGLVENIPRILPPDCDVDFNIGSWPVLPVFEVLRSIGKIDEYEMYRTFNMGIGLVLIVAPESVSVVERALQSRSPVYTLGKVKQGQGKIDFVR